MSLRNTLALVVLPAICGAAQAAQTTYTFRDGLNGYAGTRDTMVRSNETASPGDSRSVNYGWAMIPFVAGINGIDFHTREFGDVTLRPTLTVEVTPVPEPEAMP